MSSSSWNSILSDKLPNGRPRSSTPGPARPARATVLEGEEDARVIGGVFTSSRSYAGMVRTDRIDMLPGDTHTIGHGQPSAEDIAVHSAETQHAALPAAGALAEPRAEARAASFCSATSNGSGRKVGGAAAPAHPSIAASGRSGRALSGVVGAAAPPPRSAAPPWRVCIGTAVRHLKYEDTSDTRSVELGGDQVHLALVADGHGGGEASRYAAAHLLDHFVEAAAGDGSAGSLRCAGELACARVHRELLSLKPATAAGSTITVVAFNATRSQLTTINLGDSDAWAIFKGTQAQKLSEDHRFDSSPSERARVVALGGKFAHAADGHGKPCGPLRLWPGGVAQARTVGDSDVGGFISATPYTATLDVPAGCAGGTVVLASDGVWDAFAPKVATQVLCYAAVSSDPELAARLIVNRAVADWHTHHPLKDEIEPRDDTTAVVLCLRRDGAGRRSGRAAAELGTPGNEKCKCSLM